ncbi:MAG: YceD family protein [Bdellovibrionales bacterium]|nr:YceD family protein [Bdellovibrionales bacterium]
MSEIPEEGRQFTFTRESGELNTILQDLLPTAPYKIDMTIRPLGNAYEMRGRVVTSLAEVCSLCGWDLNLPLNRTFTEILVEEPEADRETHHVHGNQSVDFLKDGPSSMSYRNGVLNAAEYVHEFIALSEPAYPSCEDPDCEHLEEATKKREELAAEFARADRSEKSPFSKLQDLIKKH